MSKTITLPIKCSTVKRIDNLLGNAILTELVIYCIVSTVWMLLAVTGVLTLNRSGGSTDILTFMGSMFGCVGMWLLLYIVWDEHGRRWYNENIPTLECIGSDKDGIKR